MAKTVSKVKLILGPLWGGFGDGFRHDFCTKIGVSGRLGASWSCLGASWKRLGERLEASCRVCRVLERLGVRLGVAVPFSVGSEGFERQVRGSLPEPSARMVAAKLLAAVWGTCPF